MGLEEKFIPVRQPLAVRQVFGRRATRRRRVKKRITFHEVKARRRPFYRRQAAHPKSCHRAVFALLFGGNRRCGARAESIYTLCRAARRKSHPCGGLKSGKNYMFILYQQCNNERECGMTYIYKKQVLQDNSHNTRNTIFFYLTSLPLLPHEYRDSCQ